MAVGAPSCAIAAEPARGCCDSRLHAHFGKLELSAPLARLALSALALVFAWSLYADRAAPSFEGGLVASENFIGVGSPLGSHDNQGVFTSVFGPNAH
jgi:hypothetical protein